MATTIQMHPSLVSIGDQLKVHAKDNTRKVKEVREIRCQLIAGIFIAILVVEYKTLSVVY